MRGMSLTASQYTTYFARQTGGCDSRLRGYRVEIFNEGTADAAYTYNAPSTGDPPNENTLTIPSGTIGSQIKISIPGRTDHSYLREVEVYGNRGTCTPMKQNFRNGLGIIS